MIKAFPCIPISITNILSKCDLKHEVKFLPSTDFQILLLGVQIFWGDGKMPKILEKVKDRVHSTAKQATAGVWEHTY